MNARICSLASLVALIVLTHASPATALSVDINCGGVKVGTLSVFDGFPLGAEFKATTTLADAAKQCGEHHFNWYQVVVADNKQPKDASGKPVTAPYVDPPPGGYVDSNPSTAGDQSLLADNLPWYWNEGPPPAGKKFEERTTLGEHTKELRQLVPLVSHGLYVDLQLDRGQYPEGRRSGGRGVSRMRR